MTKPQGATVTPYLTVKGAAQAIAFYTTAFGARELFRMMADDGQRVLHAHLQIGVGQIMLSDPFPEFGNHAAPPLPGTPASVAVALALPKAEEVDATFAKALAAGGLGEMAPADMFWGDRFATVSDPFGHRWMLSAPLPEGARPPAG